MKPNGLRKSTLELRVKPALIWIGLTLLVLVQTGHAATPGQGTPAPTATSGPSVSSSQDATPDDAAPAVEMPVAPSPESESSRKQTQEALLKETFTYSPAQTLDPFVSFIAPAVAPSPATASGEEEDLSLPPEQRRPLTPLQKMGLGEIENGLRAITWGDLGRKAIIEDSAGKGYIVSIGTPVGDNNGMVTQIFNDRLVIQQEIWDGKAKRLVPMNTVVKLKKEKKE